ncbi:MAG: hypothetical protein WCF65_07555 [Parachlamydiaceae bacterium]
MSSGVALTPFSANSRDGDYDLSVANSPPPTSGIVTVAAAAFAEAPPATVPFSGIAGTARLRDLRALLTTSQQQLSHAARAQLQVGGPFAASGNSADSSDDDDEGISPGTRGAAALAAPVRSTRHRSQNGLLLQNLTQWCADAVQLLQLVRVDQATEDDVNQCLERGKQLLQSTPEHSSSPCVSAALNNSAAQAVFNWLESLRAPPHPVVQSIRPQSAAAASVLEQEQLERLLAETEAQEQNVVAAFQAASLRNRQQQAITDVSIQAAATTLERSGQAFKQRCDQSVAMVEQAHQILLDIGNPLEARTRNLADFVARLTISIATVRASLEELKSENKDLERVLNTLTDELARTKEIMIAKEQEIKEEEEDDIWDTVFMVTASILVTFVAYHAIVALEIIELTSLQISLSAGGGSLRAVMAF